MTITGSEIHGELLVSVIIPAYNHGSFISETLSSALAQHYQPIEMVVVDDGSTDDTKQRVADFGAAGIPSPGKPGMAGARNQGIALAKGQLISFLDDEISGSQIILQTVVPLFEADPGVAAVYTGFKSLRHGGPDTTARWNARGGARKPLRHACRRRFLPGLLLDRSQGRFR